MAVRVTARRRDAIDRFNAVMSDVVSDLTDTVDRERFHVCCRKLFMDSHMSADSIEQVTEIIRIIVKNC